MRWSTLPRALAAGRAALSATAAAVAKPAAAEARAIRRNPAGIQMLSSQLHRQLFHGKTDHVPHSKVRGIPSKDGGNLTWSCSYKSRTRCSASTACLDARLTRPRRSRLSCRRCKAALSQSISRRLGGTTLIRTRRWCAHSWTESRHHRRPHGAWTQDGQSTAKESRRGRCRYGAMIVAHPSDSSLGAARDGDRV